MSLNNSFIKLKGVFVIWVFNKIIELLEYYFSLLFSIISLPVSAHILFDDALEFNDEEERVPNSFVVMVCEVMDLAASSVHESAVSNPPPVRIPTPYGGQLKWTLPGGTILTAHIKDKDKIRHKKRWSQVGAGLSQGVNNLFLFPRIKFGWYPV